MKQDDLWIQPGDWKAYEAYVTGSLARRFPSAKIHADIKLPGLKSGVPRQIDVLVEGRERIAFDCKCYKHNVDVKTVEEFLGMLDDLGIRYGVLVTTKGYSDAALSRAKNDDRSIELQILSPDRLSEYQHIGAPLIWRGELGVFLSCPPGWVVDNEMSNVKGAFQVAMYPLGHTLESAANSSAFMYGNILTLNAEQKTMKEFANWHDAKVLSDCPEATFEYSDLIITDERDEKREALLRSLRIPKMGFGTEHSLYVSYDNYVLLLVVMAPPDQSEQLIKTLISTAEKSFRLHVKDKRSS